MNKLRALLVGIPIAVLIVSATTLPVYAHDGEGSHDETTQTQPKNDQMSQRSSSSEGSSGRERSETPKTTSNANRGSSDSKKTATAEQEHAHDVSKTDDHPSASDLRERGKALLAEAKDEHKEVKSKEAREKVCTNRKDTMDRRFTNITSVGTKHLTRITDVYTKAVNYKTTKNITVANWDELVSTADTAKAAATSSVAALASVKPTVDCTSDNLTTDIATFKAAVAQTRTDLQTYRKAVKAILTALESAKQEATN